MRRVAGSVKSTAVKSDDATVPLPPPRPPSPEAAARRLRLFDGLLVGVVLLFAFLSALFPVHNSDFFLHAATGRLIAHGAYAFGVDPFAFTTAGAYWVNHSWLYDLIVYLIYDSSAAGGAILIVLKALMIAALAEVMLRAARQPGQPLWIPAACVGLAILALSPRLLLQPTCCSYLFLGLTYWLLRLPRQQRARAAETGAPPPSRPFLAYWLIPPFCLVWVNMDDWFLLGPITVALVLAGELLQDRLAPAREGPDAPAPGERRTLLLVLLASVAACLVNPYHVRAFTLPSELGLSAAADAISRDVQYSTLFLSPFDQRIFQARYGLLSVAGLTYYPLALLGAASFAAAAWTGRLRWPRVLVWTAFFALSAWHLRAIPFFAVVAGPITALNFLDFAARRAGAASPADRRGGIGALVGRALTLLAGVALLAATWPGWLQAAREYRRVGWAVEPNRGLKEMAEQVAAWSHDGRIEPDGHWFNTSPDVLQYLAWYCPGERGFIDQRVSLYDGAAADYAAARASLSASGNPEPGDPAWRQVFRDHKVRYLIWSGPVSLPVLSTSPLWRLFGSPKEGEWPLLYMNGYTAVFGWRDPAAPQTKDDPFARLEYDGDRLAFGPDAVQAPAGAAPPPRPASWWESLWTAEPPRPPESDEAAAQVVRFEALRPVWRARNQPVWEAHYADLKRAWQIDAAVGCLGCGGYDAFRVEATARTLTLLRDQPPPLPSFPPKPGEEQEYALARSQFDFGPPSAAYLSVRAARRALTLKPNDASAYEALAQAYLVMSQQMREGDGGQVLGYPSLLRQVQIAAALRRAIDLDPDRETARGLAFLLYEETGFRDLAAVEAHERLRIRREEGFPEAELKTLADQVDQLDREVEKRQTTYELRAAGKSDVDRANVALQVELGGKAAEVLEKVDWSALKDSDPNKARGIERELSLMLRTGRAAEVAATLAEKEASLKDGLGADPDTNLPAYEWLRVEAAAATGDYAAADHWLEALQEKACRPVVLTQALHDLGWVRADPAAGADTRTAAALLTGHLVLREALPAAPSAVGAAWLLPHTRTWLLNVAAGQTAGLLGLQSDLDAVRGGLALEAGQTAEARAYLEAARDRAADMPFPGRPLTQTCLERLDAAK